MASPPAYQPALSPDTSSLDADQPTHRWLTAYLPSYSTASPSYWWEEIASEVLRTSHEFDDIKLVVKFTPGLDSSTAVTLLSSRRKGWLDAFLNVLYRDEAVDKPSCGCLLSTAEAIVSAEASQTERTLQHLNQPALERTGTQVDRTEPWLGERQDDSPDQPMILDGDEPYEAGTRDEAEDASGDVDPGNIEQDANSQDSLASAELASTATKSNGPWYNAEEGCWIDEPALGLGSAEQGVPFAPAQGRPQTLSQPSSPLQDPINEQDIGNITRTTSAESAPHFLPELSAHGDDGWTEDCMAELEREVRLALVGHMQSSTTRAPTPPRSRSVEASQDGIQSRDRGTAGGRSDEPREASRPRTAAQAPKELDRLVEAPGRSEPRQWELVGEAEGDAMQQQEEELERQKEELVEPAVGDQQYLVVTNEKDDPKDKEVTEALLAAQLEFNKHRFRLRGIRTRRPLTGRHTKTI
ncbi:hypothetical protein D0Z07_9189 [Hyphodiscus hymeniophilus]|uniref:Uncharacterized protein n=1 Tax=Hyphodiscus hymeniophilus TaxID=353542 RepID=A0A9P6SKH7_9HELO|nr:hypothetical protein D0Z07_9189 [Hyphodiscus hymeniophilus]